MKHIDRFEGINQLTYCWGCKKNFHPDLIKYKEDIVFRKDYEPNFICCDCLKWLKENTSIKSFNCGDIGKYRQEGQSE